MTSPTTVDYRKWPFLCECIYFPVTCWTALLHVTFKSTGLEPALSMFATGGFYGMVLMPIPVGSAVLVIWFFDKFVSPDVAAFLFSWVGIPFAVTYVIQILVLDSLHLQVKNANPLPPRNRLEELSAEFFRAGHDYLEFSCVPWCEDATLDPINQQYIFAVHAHGIHCTPLFLLSTKGSVFDQRFPNLVGSRLTGLAASVLFKVPLIRELFIATGYVDASRSVAAKALDEGRSLFVCPGGKEESMLSEIGQDVVVLKNRKGFIRLALSHGVSLVPVFGVGNTDLYKTYKVLERPRRWLQKSCGISLPIFHGRWYTPLPYKRPVKVLIGEPIPTPKPKVRGERPNDTLVDEYHAKYVKALSALHAKHVNDRSLEIR